MTEREEKNRRFFRFVSTVAFFTLLSRISGLLRDMVLAFVLGARDVADAFVVAFRIPNTVRRFVGEGSLTVSFIPVYKDILARKDGKERREFLISSFSALFFILLPVVITGIIFSPFLVKIFAPGFKGEIFYITSDLMRLTFPYLFFMGLLAYFMGFLNSHGHFASPSAAPVLLNIVLIASGLLGYIFGRERVVYWIGAGVFLSGVLQVLLQVPFAFKYGFPFRLKINKKIWTEKNTREVGKLLLPSTLSVSGYQINLLVSNIIASFLPRGSIAYLYYASRFLELPLGIFVFSVSSASLPIISESKSLNSSKDVQESSDNSLLLTLMFVVPATAGLIMLSQSVTNAFFLRGNFTPLDALLTSQAINIYSAGLIGVALSRMGIQIFYSLKMPEIPLKSAYISLVSNVLLSLLLMKPLKHNGLALATSLSSYIQFFYLNLHSKNILTKSGFMNKNILKGGLKYLTGTILMTIFLYFTSFFDRWSGRGIAGFAFLIFQVTGCSIIYFCVIYYLNDETFREFLKSMKREKMPKALDTNDK